MRRPTRLMGFTVMPLLLGALLAAEELEKATSDRDLGLSKNAVQEVAEPPEELTNTSEPGDLPATPRDFPQQPPRVPHGVEALLPITRDEHQCLECHAVKEKEEGEPTPIPASHYTDLRNSPGAVGEQLVGARYVCVTCHVSQTRNELLVENEYKAGE